MKGWHFVYLMACLTVIVVWLFISSSSCQTPRRAAKSTQSVTLGASLQIQVKRQLEIKDTLKQ